jgi:hypothetical protein
MNTEWDYIIKLVIAGTFPFVFAKTNSIHPEGEKNNESWLYCFFGCFISLSILFGCYHTENQSFFKKLYSFTVIFQIILAILHYFLFLKAQALIIKNSIKELNFRIKDLESKSELSKQELIELKKKQNMLRDLLYLKVGLITTFILFLVALSISLIVH